ncbi:MAG: response regulator [Bacteroidota bacterium]|jgi:CheY-like chemotaxis protein
MEKESSSPAVERLKDAQVAGLLREADTLIRVGRYLAAEKALEKVSSLEPTNELIQSYRDRINFLSKQLPRRISLSKDAQAEVQRTRAVLLQRKIDQANEHLVKGKEALESRDYRNATKFLQKALSIDAENIYAQALLERLKELQSETGEERGGDEAKLSAALQDAWRNGFPSAAQEQAIKKLQGQLGIPDGTRLALQRRIKNMLYKNALRSVWLTGGISAFTSSVVEELRKKFAVSLIDHSSLEAETIREVRKNKVKGTVLVVDELEGVLLEITDRLRANSFAVIAASSLEEALTTVKSVTPDIVISEILFHAGPSGFDLYRQFRSSQLTKDIPFFFMSASLDRTTRLIGKRLGVDDFFTKPIDYELLFATIDGKMRGDKQRQK